MTVPASCPSGAFNFLTWGSGVVSAVIIQFFVRGFVTRADSLNSRINELCDTIDLLSQSAHAYWSLGHADPGLVKAEADLSASNNKMNGLIGRLFNRKRKLKDDLEEAVFNLSNAATGSNFQVTNRNAEPRRYVEIQGRAMIITSRLREFQENSWIRIFG